MPTNIYPSLEVSIPFMKGYFSFTEKIGESDNPYHFGYAEYLDWRRGWYKAKKEAQPPIWKCSTFWSGLTFVLLGMLVVAFDLPFIRENPRLLGAVFTTYGIGSILLKALSGQASMQPIIVPPLFGKSKKEKG